jgi:hypothetical protein
MPFPTIGGLVIDTGGVPVTFSTDPNTYEPLNWQKRHSVHMVIGGKIVIQDFGTFMRDNALNLRGAPPQFLDEPTVIALHTRFRTKGASYGFTDWIGNVFTVFIREFVPVPFRKGADQAGGVVSLYTYSMALRVLSITKLFNVTYTGS